jgi:hypothetical protein
VVLSKQYLADGTTYTCREPQAGAVTSRPALRRTLRRGIALLLVPVAGLAIGFDRYVWSDSYGATVPDLLGTLAFELAPRLLFLGACAYLLVEGGRVAVGLLEPTDAE